MLNDVLANAMVNLKNYERVGKSECIVCPASNLIKAVLQVMQDNNYIANFEYIDDGKAGQFRVRLIGRINNCNVIKPRMPVKISDLKKYEKMYLPSRNFGTLILSTPNGVMTHTEAKKQNTGGILLTYVY